MKTSAPKPNTLYRTLCWLSEQICAGDRDFVALQTQASERIAKQGFKPDYIAICHAQTLEAAACDDTSNRHTGGYVYPQCPPD